MSEKVILISIDGMRPDGFLACGNPFIHDMMKLGSYTLTGRTVFPSVTLPCHMSMFHSVPPQRHGILTNTFVPMVNPIPGIFEQLMCARKISDMYYGWQTLRDITVSTPQSLRREMMINDLVETDVDNKLAKKALESLKEDGPDFMFLYLVETDDKGGHDNGWMTEPYLKCIRNAIEIVKKVYEVAGQEYTIIVTSDHGGHDRTHGTDMDEDMTIPAFFIGKDFTPGKVLENVSILDIAPTVVKLMGVPCPAEWEGKSLV